jgi:GcrA cell cycle regulator
MNTMSNWTDERVETLKSLWAQGLSASQVASRLGNVTRNAVIGKVHRLGLAGRATASRIRPARRGRVSRLPLRPTRLQFHARRNLAPKPVAALASQTAALQIAPTFAPEPPEPLGIVLLDLSETMCRWPIGDPSMPGFSFCGHVRAPGTTYCEHHAARAFQPARRLASPFRMKTVCIN